MLWDTHCQYLQILNFHLSKSYSPYVSVNKKTVLYIEENFHGCFHHSLLYQLVTSLDTPLLAHGPL